MTIFSRSKAKSGKSDRKPLRERRQDLYFCSSDGCIQPFPLKEAKYGCADCPNDELVAWDELPSEVRAGLDDDPQNIFTSQFPCQSMGHGAMPIRPRCRECGKLVGFGNNGKPIALFAGTNAGKTVFSAVLAHELSAPGFFKQTGITVANPYGRAYLKQIISPLFGSQGVPPEKTNKGSSHKIVFRLDVPNRATRLVTLTDMAGEEAITTSVGYHSPESIFLLNPQAVAGAMGNNQLAHLIPGFVFFAVRHFIVDCLQPLAWLDNAEESIVNTLCQRAESELKEKGYPLTVAWENLARGLLNIACGILNRNGYEDSDALLLAQELEKLAASMTSGDEHMAFEEQLEERYQYLSNIGMPSIAGQLQLKLAVVFSKADLLPPRFQPDWQTFDDMAAKAGTSHREWCDVLEQISDISRDIMVNSLKLDGFVTVVENRFSNVGYFFASNLGRDTEIRAIKIQPVAHKKSSAGKSGHQFPSSSKQERLDSSSTQPVWQVRQVLKRGADGSRIPTPRGVLYPLLWLLLTD